MSRRGDCENDFTVLDDLIEEITVDAYGEDEQLSAFCQVIEDEAPLPADGFVIGEPVSVVEIDYDREAFARPIKLANFNRPAFLDEMAMAVLAWKELR